ncbi:MAG: glycosyltransferase family 4 protein [Planctomycetia bacterium]|nr:glycosyltransferase family 4 protein [Planctomycetia bacterium]
MKRILFLAHSPLRGGAEYCLDTTLRFLDKNKFEPVVCFSDEGPMADSARKSGAEVVILPLPWWMLYEPSWWEWKNRARIPYAIWRLMQIIRSRKIDLVYTNTLTLFEGALAARWTKTPHITHIHEVATDPFMRPRWFSLDFSIRFFYKNSDLVIFESQPSLECAKAYLPPESPLCAKSAVVSNSSRFSLQDVFRAPRTSSKVEVLWVGRFSARKNPELLVRATAQLSAETRERLHVRFVGEGPLEADLREAIQNAQLEETCEIVPFQEDVRPLLASCDILVLTSHEESFGLVLVEAGMFGAPVVAVRSQGPAEIVLSGETGFLVPPGDVPALAESLEALVTNDELRSAMGAANQRRVLELYNPEQNTRQLESYIDRFS